MAHRNTLYDLLPSVRPKVEQIAWQAEKHFSSVGQTLVHDAVKELVEAQRRASAAKSVATRSGVPPGHPDFARVCRLEEKLESHMSEAARLYKLSRSYKKEIEQWRTRVAELVAQRPDLLSVFKNARRQNQLFEAVTRRPESTGTRRGSVASSGTNASLKRPSTEPGRRRPGTVAGTPRQPSSEQARSSTAPVASWNPRKLPTTPRPFGGTSSTASTAPSAARPGTAPDGAPCAANVGVRPATSSCESGEGGRRYSLFSHQREEAGPQRHNAEWLDARASSLAGQRESVQERPRLTLAEAREQQYQDEIGALEERLRRTRQEVRAMRDATSRGVVRRGWMEEFFLLCMDDSRKEFRRRKQIAAAEKVGSRTTMSASVQTSNASFACRSPGNEQDDALAGGASGEQARREEVIDILVGSDDLVAFFFEKLFPHRGAYFNIRRREGGLGASSGIRGVSGCNGVPQEPLPFLQPSSHVDFDSAAEQRKNAAAAAVREEVC